MKLNFLDIEASGLHDTSYPIEIAVLMHSGEIYEWLLKPMPKWTYWDVKAEKDCHNLTRSFLIKAGLDATEVATKLNRLLDGEIIYSDAQYWDSFWITKLFTDTDVKCLFEVHAIQDLMSPNRATRFNHVKSQLDNSGSVKHRAKEDVLQLANLSRRFIGGDLRS